MILTYNDTFAPQWEYIDKNDSFGRYKLRTSFFGIDILRHENFKETSFLDVFDYKSESNELYCVSTDQVVVCYNNKTGLPFLKPSENFYAQDVFLLSYQIPEDCPFIINERSGKFNIQYYRIDKENKIIDIVATGKIENFPFFYLTFTNEDHSKYVTKHLVTSKKNAIVSVITQEYTREEAEESKYSAVIIGKRNNPITKLTLGKCFYPYSIIVYPFSVNDKMQSVIGKKFGKDSKYVKYVNSEDKFLFRNLKALKQEGYKAATFYVDNLSTDKEALENANPQFSNMFDNVNYLTSDLKIYSF